MTVAICSYTAPTHGLSHEARHVHPLFWSWTEPCVIGSSAQLSAICFMKNVTSFSTRRRKSVSLRYLSSINNTSFLAVTITRLNVDKCNGGQTLSCTEKRLLPPLTSASRNMGDITISQPTRGYQQEMFEESKRRNIIIAV